MIDFKNTYLLTLDTLVLHFEVNEVQEISTSKLNTCYFV